MIPQKITPKDYKLILKLDKKVYPTTDPVTKKVIASWYKNNPEFGLIYKKDKKTIGTTIIIPLNKIGWNKLISGKLSESEMTSKVIFNNKRDKEIGIHIYHIEKLDTKLESFHIPSLKDINKILKELKKTNPKLKVIGLSGLCVSKSGIKLFESKFKCKERKYICKEHILKKGNKLLATNINSKTELNNLLEKDYELINRCKMLVLYPKEKSIVWKYLK